MRASGCALQDEAQCVAPCSALPPRPSTACTRVSPLLLPCLLQTTGSWPLVFGITSAHYLVGALLWSMWAGGKPLAEDKQQ